MDQQLFLILFLIHLNPTSSSQPSPLSSSRNHPKTVIYHLVTNGKSADKKHDIRHSHGILGQSVTWTPPVVTTPPPVNIVSYSWRETGFTDCSLSCLGGIQENIIHCIRDNDSMIVSQYLCNIEDKPESITITCNDQPCPPSYHIGDWGECKGTCGTGTRTRSVQCQILLDFSKMYSIFPDDQCPGIKPETTESCTLPPCPPSADLDDDEDNKYLPGNYAALIAASSSSSSSTPKPTDNSVSYYWQDSGFTECSASCLGGTQENIIQCIRDNDTMIVSHYLCNIEEKPESITKTCNDHPCPPRWTTSEFGSCSKPCGAGVQIREVKCIHEVTRGLENALHVPHHQCSEAKPIEERVCNEDPCPTTSPPPPPPPPLDKWSEGVRGKGVTGKCKGENCLTNGSSGKKKRKCNKDSTRSSMSTSHSSKCNKKRNSKGNECKSGSKCKSSGGVMDSDNNTLNPVQSFIQTSNEKRVTLRIGGTAVIHEGTILKIRCPRKKMENGLLPDIEWTKNDLPIDYDDRVSLTRLGALKISDVDFTDSATYTCVHGASKLSMTVQVVAFKPLLPSLTTTTTTPSPTYLDNGQSVNYAIETAERSNSPADYSGQLRTSAPYEWTGETKPPVNRLAALLQEIDKKNGKKKVDHSELGKWTEEKAPKSFNLAAEKPEKDSIYYADQQASQLSRNITTVYSPADWIRLSENPSSSGQFYWLVSPWSTCSTPCDVEGTMVRAIKCIEKVDDKTLERHEKACVHFGLAKPETNRICKVRCTKWTTGPWGECSICTAFGQGMQKRIVNCTSPSGQLLDTTECNEEKNPDRYQNCLNPDCRPMWIAKPWSPCSGVCSKQGTQKRSLECVWLADRNRKAFDCDNNNKPLEVRKCRVNCDKNINDFDNNNNKQADCFNVSFLCKYAVPQSCGHPVFRSSCCQSCRDNDFLSDSKSLPSTNQQSDKVNYYNQLDQPKN